MRRRICRVVLVALVMAVAVTMGATIVFDLDGVRSHDGSAIMASRDAPPRAAVQQLQFGVPAYAPAGGPSYPCARVLSPPEPPCLVVREAR